MPNVIIKEEIVKIIYAKRYHLNYSLTFSRPVLFPDNNFTEFKNCPFPSIDNYLKDKICFFVREEPDQDSEMHGIFSWRIMLVFYGFLTAMNFSVIICYYIKVPSFSDKIKNCTVFSTIDYF